MNRNHPIILWICCEVACVCALALMPGFGLYKMCGKEGNLMSVP